EDAFEHQKVNQLMAQGKAEMPIQCVVRLITLVIDLPDALLPAIAAHMPFGNAGGVSHGRLHVERMNESRPPCEPRALWNGLVLKMGRLANVQLHVGFLSWLSKG